MTLESAKILGGVIIGAALFDYAHSLLCSKIAPKLYRIEKNDTLQSKLSKPLTENFKQKLQSCLNLGYVTLFFGHIFATSPLNLSDLKKPAMVLVGGITLASFLTGAANFADPASGLGFENIVKQAIITKEACMAATIAVLPFVFSYCR